MISDKGSDKTKTAQRKLSKNSTPAVGLVCQKAA